ncbi:hypothetical protein AOC05_00270 [Arthrobacter alpinus]|uniref:Uncharacterized protein n=1 Tax=Arthrobacter alpinus TaxID=656366 RepID=A0A0M4QKJ1_9MICC|nr:hypothetical protein AOC05_00270 [Arthrobacter alpinus]
MKKAGKSLGQAFDALEKVSNAQILGLTLHPEPHKRSSLGTKTLNVVRKLSRANNIAQNVTTFKVKAVNPLTDKVETINLLEDKLVSSQKVVTVGPNSRAVDSISAFAAIDSAYAALKSELLVAAGISGVNTSSP